MMDHECTDCEKPAPLWKGQAPGASIWDRQGIICIHTSLDIRDGHMRGLDPEAVEQFPHLPSKAAQLAALHGLTLEFCTLEQIILFPVGTEQQCRRSATELYELAGKVTHPIWLYDCLQEDMDWSEPLKGRDNITVLPAPAWMLERAEKEEAKKDQIRLAHVERIDPAQGEAALKALTQLAREEMYKTHGTGRIATDAEFQEASAQALEKHEETLRRLADA